MNGCFQDFSLHNHSNFSDGESSVEDVVCAAVRSGVKYVGISDHLCLHPGKPGTMGQKDLEKYVQYVRKIGNQSNVHVLLGAEVDVPITDDEWKLCAELKQKYQFDYFIGSVHPFSCYEDKLAMKNKFDTDLPSLLKEHSVYWSQVYSLAQSDLFEILGHLDVYKVSGAQTEQYFIPEIANVLDVAKVNNKIVEVNTSGFYESLVGEQLPSNKIVSGCVKRGIPLILSSDSHNCKHVVRDFERGKNLVTKLGGAIATRYSCAQLKKIFNSYHAKLR